MISRIGFDNSRSTYNVREVSDACASVEAAFSKFYFHDLDEGALKAELAKTMRPFVRQHKLLVYDEPWEEIFGSSAKAFFLYPSALA